MLVRVPWRVYGTYCPLERIPMVLVIVCWCFSATYCQRRIVNGTISLGEPRYLAYFVKSPKSNKEYTGWVCGGTIIHPLFILTSAACLEDVRHVFAIAGYNKYVKSEDIENDECTKRTKKKIVARSFQKDIHDQQDQHSWNARDISLARVDTPFDFRDPIYVTYCSFSPGMIRVNYNSNFEEPGTQAVTFGWGHKQFYRQDGDDADHNEEYLNYASTVVIDKESCKELLTGNTDITEHVNLYLICTSGPGHLDEKGRISDISSTFNVSIPCLRRSNTLIEKNITNSSFAFYMTNDLYNSVNGQIQDYRRNGPCQNDHGGPLVTWIGGREYVIGVACGFQVNNRMECVGPYLYTSTFSNGEFIYCMLRYSRRRLCDMTTEQRGYQIIEEEINWEINDFVSSKFGSAAVPMVETRIITELVDNPAREGRLLQAKKVQSQDNPVMRAR